MIRLVATFSRQVQTNKRDEKYHQFIFTCALVCHPLLWQEAPQCGEWTHLVDTLSKLGPSGFGFIICLGQQLCVNIPALALSSVSFLTV